MTRLRSGIAPVAGWVAAFAGPAALTAALARAGSAQQRDYVFL